MEAAPKQPRGDKLTKILSGLTVILLVAIVGLGAFVLGRESADDELAPASGASQYDFSTLNLIVDQLHQYYFKQDNIDDQTLYEAAINGLTSVFDDAGTYYVNPSDYNGEVKERLTGSFEGIGATISQQGTDIVIVAPIKGTPAEKAGLQSGDTILEVNGELTTGWTSQKTAQTIRGPRGTQVSIKIRHTDATEKVYTLTRDKVPVQSVSTLAPNTTLRDAAGAIVGDVGYMDITDFTPLTAGEVQTALQDLKSKGMKGLIVDLRSNPGGSLEGVKSIVDMFLTSGTIVIQRDANGRETVSQARSGNEQVANDLPIAVLQNRGSASASEIFSAALRDANRATIVGEKSYGKATVNITRDLPDGGVLSVSIGQWLTPNGTLIDKVGIRPDIEIVPTDEDIDLRRDVQLFKAIEVLRDQIR